MTFPVYTVSAINGHYFAGGFCLSQVSFDLFYPALFLVIDNFSTTVH